MGFTKYFDIFTMKIQQGRSVYFLRTTLFSERTNGNLIYDEIQQRLIFCDKYFEIVELPNWHWTDTNMRHIICIVGIPRRDILNSPFTIVWCHAIYVCMHPGARVRVYLVLFYSCC